MPKARKSSHDLPRRLDALVQVIGEQKCLALLQQLGGTMIYIPKKALGGETLLLKAIGEAAVVKLTKSHFAGTHLDLPVAGRAVTLWLAARGHQNNEIARLQHISAHTVRRRLSGATVEKAQMDLFLDRVAHKNG